eukprot:365025-Chlamydomonas_euryale.AAC.15
MATAVVVTYQSGHRDGDLKHYTRKKNKVEPPCGAGGTTIIVPAKPHKRTRQQEQHTWPRKRQLWLSARNSRTTHRSGPVLPPVMVLLRYEEVTTCTQGHTCGIPWPVGARAGPRTWPCRSAACTAASASFPHSSTIEDTGDAASRCDQTRPELVRVRVEWNHEGYPVLNAARQRGSSSGLGAVTTGTSLCTAPSHP